ncbi:MAG: twin-arginine translocase TatA/TatE family subunit [Nitrospinaceae bacterium]|jgi:TatA/E family protein of Tat protein translocase|nr:twin-arginine translocase TatA/TatE family subunit [Nitrospinaceae bacterium]|tara:strand:+ start:793 stop:1077 length:285 start_codon:yes stop_codon:yes gene_type:complete
MMGIGFPELMIILVIIMIIFGAGKLPEIGSAFGNSIRNFKKSMKEAEEETEQLSETTDAASDTTEAEKEVTEEDSEEPQTAENPVASTTESKDK